MIGIRFVDKTPWLRGEWEKPHLVLRSELSFPKLGSVLVGFSDVCQTFLETNIAKIAVFDAECEFWPVDWYHDIHM